MKISTNFKEYMQGRAKLQNAMHIDPDDKIQNMLKQSTNHRFWANDYNSFKKGLLQDVEPAPVVLEGLTLRQKSQGSQILTESLQSDGTHKFVVKLNYRDVHFDKLPKEICPTDDGSYIDECQLIVTYSVQTIYDSLGIEKLEFSFDQIDVGLTIQTWEEETDTDRVEQYHTIMKSPTPEARRNFSITVYSAPYYLKDIGIDCQNTMDSSKWKVYMANFGNYDN